MTSLVEINNESMTEDLIDTNVDDLNLEACFPIPECGQFES